MSRGASSDENADFADLNLDNKTIRAKIVRLSGFTRCGFKGATFKDCILTHNRFQGCYFRKTKFEETKLDGCVFNDCSFDDAVFTSCSLSNAEFINCAITYNQIAAALSELPHNVRWKLARNLRLNSEMRGQVADARKFLIVELESSETHNFRKAFYWRDPFYGKKYRARDRVIGAWEWGASKVSRYLWGYGELPFRVVVIAAIVAAIFAAAYSRMGTTSFVNLSQPLPWYEFFMMSVAFLTGNDYGNVLPQTGAARDISIVERVLGVLFFGVFVATVYRRISRR
jgi:pentapeptide repeat protein/ion channel